MFKREDLMRELERERGREQDDSNGPASDSPSFNFSDFVNDAFGRSVPTGTQTDFSFWVASWEQGETELSLVAWQWLPIARPENLGT